MSFTGHFGKARRDVLRWAFCVAVALVAHGGIAAFALLKNASADSGFDAGAPVVMIDFPDAPAASATPPNDVAPGPAEPESEQTPPPREETKPPADVAEVALPEPEPPKPEPRAEDKPAAAPPSVAMVPAAPAPPVAGAEVQPSVAVRRWESTLLAHIERFKRYPPQARSRGEVQVAFTIDREGRLRKSRIVESSGSPELDQETLAMLTRAQPLPKPPGDLQRDELTFVVPVRFNKK